jgi:7-cyano-7-deazaguanine reductase
MKKDFKALGNKVGTPEKPDKSILETFPNPGVRYVGFQTKEVTSLCPKTGQPDFITVLIRYSPLDLCLESKSLKLYLQSYRNEKCFMEELAIRIYNDISDVLNVTHIGVEVQCTPRGGIVLNAFAGEVI